MVHVNADRRVAGVLAALIGDLHRRRREPDAIGVGRVHADLRVIEGADVVVRRLLPGAASVSRAVEAALERLCLRARGRLRVWRAVGLDHHIHDVAVGGRDRDLHAALHGRREAATLHLGPALTTVGRLPERGARAARTEEVGSAQALIARRPEHVRVARVEVDVHEASGVVDELLELPGRAAVRRLVEAAILVGRPRRAEGRDPRDVRVGGVHLDATDVLRGLEAHERPCETAVDRLENAATRGDRVARVGLARTEIEDVRVARRDREIAE